MKVTIDNQDGAGPVDYTNALVSSRLLTIARKLNEPTLCSFALSWKLNSYPLPIRNARTIVSRDDETICFSGYVPLEPESEFAGIGTQGAVYLYVVSAVSDELLLDRQLSPYTSGSVGTSAAQLLKTLVGRAGAAIFNTNAVTTSSQVGRFVARAGAPWSKNARAIAASGRSVYRAVDGWLSLTAIGSTSHALNESDGSLQLSGLKVAALKTLANDVTICGDREPTAYVTEVFEGDGVTVLFNLTGMPYYPAGSRRTLLKDTFQSASISTSTWRVTDAAGVLGISSAGLTFNGGGGLVGQTTVVALDNIEIGGSLLLECGAVQLQTGSNGLLCALYNGAMQESNCFAGFRVKQSGGGTVIVPMVGGVEAGSSFSFTVGSLYQLRLRIHCDEMQRVLATYYSAGDGPQQSFGGDLVAAAAKIVMEVQQVTNGLPSAPVVLYDGTIASAAAACTLALVDSANLLGALRSVTVTQTGTAWVKSVLPSGTTLTRRLGTTAQGADCRIETTGRLHFYTTRIPVNGELIVVNYRASGRAVARLASTNSMTNEESAGAGGIWQWTGSITHPSARSSADCENAGAAMLNMSTSRSAARQGKYTCFYPHLKPDVWPGDLLAISSASQSLSTSLVVRTVLIEHGPSMPEVLKYSIGFANDWAEELSLQLSTTVPQDAWIPQLANVAVLASLTSLLVTSVTATTVNIDAGLSPPINGGFEVRRRDWAFGPGIDSDLILRSPVRNFVLPREAPIEQYYIRMYDGLTPPSYSRFSGALFLSVLM